MKPEPKPEPVVDEREAKRRALLRAEPWGRLLAQLTAIALKRTNGRSVADAKDYAQSAVAAAYESVARGGWDPDRGALMSYLVARVITGVAAERRRKRNTCEVWLDEEADDAEEKQTVSSYEKHLAKDEPAPDVALHRLRLASTLEERLVARLAGDAPALQVIPLLKEGLYQPTDLEAATGRPAAEMKEAVRRIRYHAREITKELSAQVDTPARDARGNEVMQ